MFSPVFAYFSCINMISFAIWDQWDDETKSLFCHNYGDLPYLLEVKVDEQLFRAITQFWNPAYNCFTFGRVDLVPTIEEYTALLHCPRVQIYRIYSRAAYVPAFWKKLMSITGMSEEWVTARIKQNGEYKCIPWRNLRDLILTHPDASKKTDVFALSFYGLMLFPKALGHVDEAVIDFFDRLSKGATPVPAILAETFRSLNACRRSREGRFVGCAQLLLVWLHSHFWKVNKVSCRIFTYNYSPLKEIVTTPRRDDVLEENWIALLQNLQEEGIEWKAPWFIPNEILFRCGNFDWFPLLGIWGAIGYALLLVLRQYETKQFIPTTHGLAQCEFQYKGENYKKKVKEISTAWNQIQRMKKLTVGPRTTPEYSEWISERINDNIPGPRMEGIRSMEEYLRIVPSELEIIKQDFERKNRDLEKKIEQLEEEKMHLKLDADIQKMEAEKQRKRKSKAEEDLDSLKMDSKKMRISMKTTGLGKTQSSGNGKFKLKGQEPISGRENFESLKLRKRL
ncbi:myosin heavy chain-like [Gossypium australe]|uniref:Myosin heavy chain-like n=1 Tax=Gossypium australe TaxID=47621 RepID=A0A5B6UJF4_9ROSI|nr:myosin heavy chain-like [Gossypium australe]